MIYKNLTITGFGIDAWLATKKKDELDEIWDVIYRTMIKGDLVIEYDKIFALDNFKEAIQSDSAGEGRILLQ